MTAMIEAFTWFLERVCEYVFASFLSWSNFLEALGQIPRVFTNFSNGLAWPYLLSSLALAWVIYVHAKRRGSIAATSFREFAFPASLYRHPSTRLDCRFAAIDIVLTFLLYVPIITGIGLLGAKVMSVVLVGLMSWEPPRTMSPMVIVAAGIGFLILYDFINYWAHVLFHKVPLLWSFHQVHHSVEVLTPAAAYRIHPVEIIGFAVLQAPAVGLSAVFYENILGRDHQITMIFGVSIVGFVLTLLGTHLRHSHVWFSYGPVLNRVFMSPAHHQIHHSIDPRHWNKNFSVKLAVWDALFGTLYVPREPETLQVGLPDADRRDFTTVRKLYFLPFEKAARGLLSLGHRRG
ncbi:MAG: sterol desaturase family protein [Nitrospiraceae bacterium]|nr:MAG: sterol desaturase family protein [Nitrospiraceae bacterium]